VNDATPRPSGFHCARLFGLAPYALAAVWDGMAPTQALMAAMLLEMLFPAGTHPLRMAVRHLALWATLLFLLPDPFVWWLAPAWCGVLCLSHRWWSQSPRIAGGVVAILLLPALFDVTLRLDAANAVSAAGARNPWVAYAEVQSYGQRLEFSGIGIVIPAQAAPFPLTGSWKAQTRALGFLACAILLLLAISRRRHPAVHLLALLPVLLAYALLRPPLAQSLWVQIAGEEDWQVLTFSWPLERDQSSGQLLFDQRRPGAEELRPLEPVATVERGPLLAPKESGEEGILTLLRHWADAKIDPDQSLSTEKVPPATKSSWEIDSRGVLVLRALP